MTNDTDNRDWAWMLSWEEGAIGPFSTRAEAVADAIDTTHPGDPVLIGRVKRINPADYVLDDPNELTGSMDERAAEDGWEAEDPLFPLREIDGESAWNDLHGLMVGWCAKWIQADAWQIVDEMPMGEE